MNAPTSRIAPPFPTNPSIGEWFGNWVWNGARWVCSSTNGMIVKTQVFGAPGGPYMPSPGLTSCVVECVGGGGAGGGVISPNTTYALSGGGGGAGAYSRIALAAALVAGGVNVAVGGAGQPADGAAGGSGGQTAFGALCVANGGQGGQPNLAGVNGSWGNFGFGGSWTGAVGDIVSSGEAGGGGTTFLLGSGASVAWGGNGGNGPWGGGGPTSGAGSVPGTGSSAPGFGGEGPGAGGGGASANELAATQPGGVGVAGLCIVTEYCWADGSEDDCLNPPVNVNARVAVTQVPWTGPGPCPPGWGGPQGFIESDD